MSATRMVLTALALALPGVVSAQDAVIRLEARPDAQAGDVARDWAMRIQGVVTLPLEGGWTGIAIGPLPAARAEALLGQLQAAGRVPADAFVSLPPPGTALTPVGATPEAAPVPGVWLRLTAPATEAEARAALDSARADLPEAGLWTDGDGFAIALGPVAPDAAEAWLPILVQAGLAPRDAAIVARGDLGRALDAGGAPELPAPGDPEPMPPLDAAQRDLRWAGHYPGAIDGLDGPMTRAAIQAEIATARAATDPGRALRLLSERRAAWAADQGLEVLTDAATGLRLTAPMRALAFDRVQDGMAIYGPRDGSGAALILFSRPGDQAEMLRMAGLVTALGWVPRPDRQVRRGHVTLRGGNDDHLGGAEMRLRDGRAEGWVLIWPASDPVTHARLMAQISDSLAGD